MNKMSTDDKDIHYIVNSCANAGYLVMYCNEGKFYTDNDCQSPALRKIQCTDGELRYQYFLEFFVTYLLTYYRQTIQIQDETPEKRVILKDTFDDKLILLAFDNYKTKLSHHWGWRKMLDREQYIQPPRLEDCPVIEKVAIKNIDKRKSVARTLDIENNDQLEKIGITICSGVICSLIILVAFYLYCALVTMDTCSE
jgi:hypothetical protein